MMELISSYCKTLQTTLDTANWLPVQELAEDLLLAAQNGQSVYICGNGGSAGNAIHLANDFLYGISPEGNALSVEALSANPAVLTCLGNDIGYDKVYSHQLKVKGRAEDILIVLSGSGNSPNIIAAIEVAKQKNIKTYAILGFTGGEAKELVDCPIHFPVQDMQISEDLQLIVGHMLMKYLNGQLKS